MGEQLKTCPFDGGTCDEALLGAHVIKISDEKHFAQVMCGDCGASGPKSYADSDENARSLATYSWNDRIKPTKGRQQ